MAHSMTRLLTKRRVGLVVAVTAVVCILAVAAVYLETGAYGINAILRHGLYRWTPVAADDARLSASMRAGLRTPPPKAVPGAFAWQEIDEGFGVAELPVIADGVEVDRLLLARIDPSRFRFTVRNAAAGDRELDDWMRATGAVLVINASFFRHDGTPETPVLSEGIRLGPQRYQATHGAFVASANAAEIRDLSAITWQKAFAGADNAFVSYPLLIGPGGIDRVKADPRWLANRSFIAQDSEGRIILGTTREAFFSLDRLAAFLRDAPLGLTRALNLDGGPVACQAIALRQYRRDYCGLWEMAVHDGQLKLLPLSPHRRWTLPNVLAVVRK